MAALLRAAPAGCRLHVVHFTWLEACLGARRRLPEADFDPTLVGAVRAEEQAGIVPKAEGGAAAGEGGAGGGSGAGTAGAAGAAVAEGSAGAAGVTAGDSSTSGGRELPGTAVFVKSPKLQVRFAVGVGGREGSGRTGGESHVGVWPLWKRTLVVPLQSGMSSICD